jgi:hypothetical protein
MDTNMTPEEELELANNIAKIKAKIRFNLIGLRLSIITAVLLIFNAFTTSNYDIFLSLICVGAVILCVAYGFLNAWDFNSRVLAGIEKSDYNFFINNP